MLQSVFVFSLSGPPFIFSIAFISVSLVEGMPACAFSSALRVVVSRVASLARVSPLATRVCVLVAQYVATGTRKCSACACTQPEPDQLLLGHLPCTGCTECAAGRAKPSKQAF